MSSSNRPARRVGHVNQVAQPGGDLAGIRRLHRQGIQQLVDLPQNFHGPQTSLALARQVFQALRRIVGWGRGRGAGRLSRRSQPLWRPPRARPADVGGPPSRPRPAAARRPGNGAAGPQSPPERAPGPAHGWPRCSTGPRRFLRPPPRPRPAPARSTAAVRRSPSPRRPAERHVPRPARNADPSDPRWIHVHGGRGQRVVHGRAKQRGHFDVVAARPPNSAVSSASISAGTTGRGVS